MDSEVVRAVQAGIDEARVLGVVIPRLPIAVYIDGHFAGWAR